MARINTNIGAITTQRHLNKAYASLNETIQRLASGLRINRGADDPAGLIVSERLRTEIESVNQAILNTQRASNIVATTEGALDEVARLLTDIQSLIVEAANEGAAIAHQTHGAIGFTAEHILHRYTNRLWAWRDEFGNEAQWAVRLGEHVAAHGADGLWPMLAVR